MAGGKFAITQLQNKILQDSDFKIWWWKLDDMPGNLFGFVKWKLSARIKHAPNRGYRFVSPSPPFPQRELAGFQYRKTPFFFSWGSPTISTGSPAWIRCFPPPGNWGQNATRNGGPQYGACLILLWNWTGPGGRFGGVYLRDFWACERWVALKAIPDKANHPNFPHVQFTEYHGVGNFYLINSKRLKIGIGIGKFSVFVIPRNFTSITFLEQMQWGG